MRAVILDWAVVIQAGWSLVIHGFWLWSDSTVVLDMVAFVLQIKSSTDSINVIGDVGGGVLDLDRVI